MLNRVLRKIRAFMMDQGIMIYKRNNLYLTDQKALAWNPCDEIVIFDIGANKGKTVVQYSELFPENRQIYAFEPILQKRISKSVGSHIIWNNVAVGSSTKLININKNSSIDTSSVLRARLKGVPQAYRAIADNKEVISVQCISLDEFCKDNHIERINILKLDIQGGELDALKGAQGLLINTKVDLIITEMYWCEFYDDQPLAGQIIDYLSKYNYTLHNIYNEAHSGLNGRLMWCDAIFISERLKRDSEKLLESWLGHD